MYTYKNEKSEFQSDRSDKIVEHKKNINNDDSLYSRNMTVMSPILGYPQLSQMKIDEAEQTSWNQYKFKEGLENARSRSALSRNVAVNATSGRASIQRKEKEENPYPEGTRGLTAHHIIPQSVLTNVMALLSEDNQALVLASSLPDYERLTIHTLNNAAITSEDGDPFVIKYRGDVITKGNIKNNEEAREIYFKSFGDLSEDEQLDLTFDNLSWGNFRALYVKLMKASSKSEIEEQAAIKAGVPLDDENGQVEPEYQKLMDMYNAFYQWQPGNLFYGPARYEEESANTFDADEKYSNNDPDFSASLLKIYEVLKSNENKLNVNQKIIVENLRSLTALTKNRDVSPFSADSFVQIETDEQLNLLTSIEVNSRNESGKEITRMGFNQTGKSLHRRIIIDKVREIWSRIENDEKIVGQMHVLAELTKNSDVSARIKNDFVQIKTDKHLNLLRLIGVGNRRELEQTIRRQIILGQLDMTEIARALYVAIHNDENVDFNGYEVVVETITKRNVPPKVKVNLLGEDYTFRELNNLKVKNIVTILRSLIDSVMKEMAL